MWEVVQCRDTDDENITLDPQHIYGQVMESFTEAEIPSDNLSIFCADTAHVMVGVNNSVAPNATPERT